MSPSRFSIATTSRLVRPLSFREIIRCLTYLGRAAMIHHMNLRRNYNVYKCSAVPLLPKMRNLESLPHLQKASSEDVFRNIGRSLPNHQKQPSASSEETFRFAEEAFRIAAKLRCKRKSRKTFRRGVSFLKTCAITLRATYCFFFKLWITSRTCL